MNHNSKLSLQLLITILMVLLLERASGSYHVVMSDSHMNFISTELASAYKDSVIQAISITPEKINKNLFPIDRANTKLRWRTIGGEDYLLAVNLFEDDTKYEGKELVPLDHGDVWVTAFPQLYEFCIDYTMRRPQANMSDIGLRLNQLLGLPANNVGYTLVEFWVRPTDLFRPCPDPEIWDEKCDIDFPLNATKEHSLWINNLRAMTYADAEKNIEYGGFPWTQLGYTYDWSPESQSKIGLSEYVAKKGSNVYIQNVYTLTDYCQVKSKSY